MKEYLFKDNVTSRYEKISYYCKRWRIVNNITLQDVADETGYSKDNIIKFEQGKNNNATILLFYLLKGLKIDNIVMNGGVKNEVATDS